MISFLSNLVNGISLGSVYAIIALGYSMVYGIAKMLNFAHGDVIMVGAYICFCGTQYWGLPPVAALLVSILVSTVSLEITRLPPNRRMAPTLNTEGNTLGLELQISSAMFCKK